MPTIPNKGGRTIKAMAADTDLTPPEDAVPDSTVDGQRSSEDAPCHR